jgi:hypothetical protein
VIAQIHQDDIGPQLQNAGSLKFVKTRTADELDIGWPPPAQAAGQALAHQPDSAPHEQADLAWNLMSVHSSQVYNAHPVPPQVRPVGQAWRDRLCLSALIAFTTPS